LGTDSALNVSIDGKTKHSTGTHAMLRSFTDSTGVEWRVWEVSHTKAGSSSTAKSFSNAKLQGTAFAEGWLCFESKDEKRRLAPIPIGWEKNEHPLLEKLLAQAKPVQLRRNGGRVSA
jgi:hypothetical protein